MTKEEFTKKFKRSLELKKQMMEELEEVQRNIQMEIQTTGHIACL